MNRLLNKLLRHHINTWQLAGFVLANLCGMAIVLAAVQFHADVKPLFAAGDSFLRPGQVVVTKRVSSVGTLTGKSPAFSEKEIRRMQQQPFVQRLGQYTPAMFSVFATIGSQQMGMEFSTEMFFEAVPDEFIDVQTDKWSYDPESDDVPIILPRAYLNLYNFGFASSQGLPTISEKLAGKVAVRLRLTGTHGVKLKTGRVVAFSRRLNTILVPQQFLDHMNQQLSPGRTPQAARLIIETDNPADERIAQYLSDMGYDTEANDADASKTASLMRIIITVVLAVGLLISALAFYVLLLSIFLLLQKHTEKIDNLLLIGYSPASVASPFRLLALVLNALVLVLAMVAVVLLRQWYLPLLGSLDARFEPSAFVPTLLTGVALFLLVTAINHIAINRKVRAIWHMHE
ncbi:MAG: ABC transporter permease [Prevotella sp.]|nr:ABC transporter permease [Prevotella sp.]